MSCHEASFANAICRIDVSDRTADDAMPTFVAHLWLIDEDRSARHELVLGDERPAEIHAPTEALAVSSALSYLESRYGALSATAHVCDDFTKEPAPGEPVKIEDEDAF